MRDQDLGRCGGCTLCCTLLAVEALDKPAYADCQHCTSGVGCNIYGEPERPFACSAFRCAYYFNESWPDELRPDRCGVVFEPFAEDEHLCFVGMVAPDLPNSWRKGAAAKAIDMMMRNHSAVIVVEGDEKHVLLPDKETTPEVVWGLYEKSARKLWQRQPMPPT